VQPKEPAAPIVTRPVDPDGWFPVGAASPSTSSAVVAFAVRLAIDEQHTPWLAVTSDLGVRVGPAGAPLGPVPGVQGVVAFGTRGQEPVLAVTNGSKLERMERVGTVWNRRVLPSLCAPISLGWGEGSTTAAYTFDRKGDLWQACIEGIRGPFVARPSGPSIPEVIWDDHPVVGTRLHVARAEGARWVELAPRSTPKDVRYASLSTDASGLLQLRVEAQPIVAASLPTFLVDPAKRAFAPASGATGVSAEELTGTRVRRDALTVAALRTDGCFEEKAAWGGCVWTLGQSENGGPLRPLSGEWGDGLHGVDGPTLVALALDAAGAPIVAFDDQGHTELRRWDGKAFVALPPTSGRAPHGLAVAAEGDVLVGAWDTVKEPAPSIFRRNRYVLSRIRNDAVTVLDPLVLPRASEWARMMPERTRLDATDGVHMSTVNAAVQAGLSRATFVLRDGRFEPEPDHATMPATLPFSVAVVPPRFLGPGDAFPTRAAAFSRYTTDASGRPTIAWAENDRIHVAFESHGEWTRLDDELLPETHAVAAPAVAASRDRVCVAWVAAGAPPSIFVRCHRASAK
jgi:hypothetical protein